MGPGAKLPDTKTGTVTSEGSSQSVVGLVPSGVSSPWLEHTCHKLQVASYAIAGTVTSCMMARLEIKAFAIEFNSDRPRDTTVIRS